MGSIYFARDCAEAGPGDVRKPSGHGPRYSVEDEYVFSLQKAMPLGTFQDALEEVTRPGHGVVALQ